MYFVLLFMLLESPFVYCFVLLYTFKYVVFRLKDFSDFGHVNAMVTSSYAFLYVRVQTVYKVLL